MLKAPRLLYDNTTNKLHHYLNAAYIRLGRVKNVPQNSLPRAEEYCESDLDDLPNTALLVRVNELGKIATVYALAHEMGFKVLDVNATVTRNSRQVLASLC